MPPISPPHPACVSIVEDPERLQALRESGLLDTGAEEAFDRVSELARRLTGAPVALVSLIDVRRQFFKSALGLSGWAAQARETPLSHSFCQHVVTRDAPLVVEDARSHPLVCSNGAVADLGVIGYLGVPIHAPSGFALGSLCAITDAPRAWRPDDLEAMQALAAQLETELALRQQVRLARQSDAHHRGVLARLTDIVFGLEDGRFVYLNAAWQARLGIPVEQALGRAPAEFASAGGTDLAGEQARSAGGGRLVLRSADGTDRLFEGRWAPGSGGRTLTGTLTDITDTVLLDAERQARQAAERAAREAQRAARLKTALLNNFHHEMRTPLAAVISCAQVLEMDVAEDLRELVAAIGLSGERLLDTLTLAMDLAQLEAGELKPRAQAFDAASHLRGVAAPFEQAMRAKGLAFALELPDALPVTADTYLLRRITECLLDNARKFTPSGSVKLAARAEAGRLRVSVSDTGPGLPSEAAPRVFEAFWQGSSGDARLHEGLGLGLTVARAMAELLGGTLVLDAQPAGGVVARLELPC